MGSWGKNLLIIDRGNVSVKDQSLFIAGGGGGSEDFGLNTVKYDWPLPLNDILPNWSPHNSW